MNRRQFLSMSVAGTALGALPIAKRAWADTAAASTPTPTALKALTRTLEVNGKPATVFGLTRADGARGLEFTEGDTFDVTLTNELAETTLIHWHGLTPPWPMDGVPDVPAPLLKTGESRRYTFPVGKGGTYWMHAHTLQEQNLLAAPLIVRPPKNTGQNEQDVVVLLHDFSFTPAEEVLKRLKSAPAPMGRGNMDMNNMDMGGMNMNGMDMPGMDHQAMMQHMGPMHRMMGGMDLNDIAFDAYLANDRTLADPEVTRVESGGTVRLRIINGATATAFTIDTGKLAGELVAVDGQDVVPAKGTRFPIVMGQRLDIRVNVPKDGGAFPVLALREGARERAGWVLATTGATIAKIPVVGPGNGPVTDLRLEGRLAAIQPLPAGKPDRRYTVTLTGTMAGYSWNIQGADALKVRRGERIEIAMRNMSMMMHPMHLHGHHFQVVGLNGKAVSGAVRDTVAVPPMASVTIAFDAGNPGRWAFHCHHLYHMATGMMAFVDYEDRA
jgi:FtsP/CotA-like multicopper oxidase with cupredoxin domain